MKRAIILVLITLIGFSVNAQELVGKKNQNNTDKNAALSKFNLRSVTDASVPASAIDLNNQGIRKALLDNNYGESVGYFRRSVEAGPNCLACRYNLGISLLRTNQPVEALEVLQKLISEKNDDAEYLAGIGEAFYQNGRHAEAVKTFSRAYELKPTDAVIANNLGNSLNELKEYDRALKYFDAAIKAQPDLAAAHSNRGVTLFHLGRLKQAIESLRRAHALEPNSAETNNNLGVALSQSGKKKEAHQYFLEAVRLRPDWSYALFNLASNQLELGDRDAASAGLRALEKIDFDLAGELKKQLWGKYVVNALQPK